MTEPRRSQSRTSRQEAKDHEARDESLLPAHRPVGGSRDPAAFLDDPAKHEVSVLILFPQLEGTQVDLYEKALACYEKGDRETARNLFQRANHGRLDGDGPSRFFLETMDRADSRESGVLEMGEK